MTERVGVYHPLHCGTNIAGKVDVEEVARWAGEQDQVAVARDYSSMCSSLGQELIEDDIGSGPDASGSGGLFAAHAREERFARRIHAAG